MSALTCSMSSAQLCLLITHLTLWRRWSFSVETMRRKRPDSGVQRCSCARLCVKTLQDRRDGLASPAQPRLPWWEDAPEFSRSGGTRFSLPPDTETLGTNVNPEARVRPGFLRQAVRCTLSIPDVEGSNHRRWLGRSDGEAWVREPGGERRRRSAGERPKELLCHLQLRGEPGTWTRQVVQNHVLHPDLNSSSSSLLLFQTHYDVISAGQETSEDTKIEK